MKADTKRGLVSAEDFAALNPRGQGYASYMQSAWPDSKIPKANIYPAGSKEHEEWTAGEQLAVLQVQDSEE